jgi:hypothetical protein
MKDNIFTGIIYLKKHGWHRTGAGAHPNVYGLFMTPIRQRFAEMIVRLVQLPAIALAVAGVFVFGSQCLWWIQDHIWYPKTLLDLWLDLGGSFRLVGAPALQRVVLWLLDLPLSGGLLVGGIALFWLGNLVKRTLNLGRSRAANRRGF